MTEQEQPQEQPVESNLPEVKTEEQLKAENAARLEEIKRQIEAARLPLNETSSTDVVQRINALTNILKTTVSIPKFTQEKISGQNISRITGSFEISVFPSYGEYDENYANWCYNTFTNVMVRITELAAKL